MHQPGPPVQAHALAHAPFHTEMMPPRERPKIRDRSPRRHCRDILHVLISIYCILQQCLCNRRAVVELSVLMRGSQRELYQKALRPRQGCPARDWLLRLLGKRRIRVEIFNDDAFEKFDTHVCI